MLASRGMNNVAKRPRNLVFAQDERPPAGSVLILALQHAALSVLFLVYAAMVAKGAGFTQAQQQGLLVGTLISCGIGAALQAGWPRYASGLLVVPLASPIFVIFGIQAGREVGPAGIATLAIAGGISQILIGRLLRRLRAFFPPEVCGVVVLMLGVSILPHAFHRILGFEGGAAAFDTDAKAIVISLATMGSIIAGSVWLKGTKRFFALLFGCIAGYLLAAALGELSDFTVIIGSAPLVSLPDPVLPSLQLGLPLIAAFALLSIVSAVDGMGVLISTERLEDAEWSRPDIGMLSRGISAAGACSVLSGLLGGAFLGLSSTNIGLAFATGVTSRIVGVAAGVLLIAASFFPKLLAVVTAMPEPVLGGILGYAASYFIVAGADLALSRMMSPRRMIVIGVPVAAGIAVQATPAMAEGATGLTAILLHSPLILSSIMAIALNAVMRIGIAQSASLEVREGAARHEQVLEALEQWGEVWGLKRATVLQANTAVNQLLEAVADLREGDVVLEARHDELNFDLRIVYAGQPMVFPDRAPTPDEMLNDDDGVSRMAGWLVRHLAHHAEPFTREGKQGVLLRFES